MLNRGHVQHSIMTTVTSQRFNLSVKQLIVGHTTTKIIAVVWAKNIAILKIKSNAIEQATAEAASFLSQFQQMMLSWVCLVPFLPWPIYSVAYIKQCFFVKEYFPVYRHPVAINVKTGMPPFRILANHKIKMCHNSMKKIMIQKITQNNWNFWTVNLIMRAKKLLTSRQIFRYAVPARTVTKKHCL